MYVDPLLFAQQPVQRLTYEAVQRIGSAVYSPRKATQCGSSCVAVCMFYLSNMPAHRLTNFSFFRIPFSKSLLSLTKELWTNAIDSRARGRTPQTLH